MDFELNQPEKRYLPMEEFLYPAEEEGKKKVNRYHPRRRRRWFLKFAISSAILLLIGKIVLTLVDRIWYSIKELLVGVLSDPLGNDLEVVENSTLGVFQPTVSTTDMASVESDHACLFEPIDSSSEEPVTESGLRIGKKERRLEGEDEYREYLTSLNLRFINPDDVIRPHRNITRGVKNELPPKKYWSRIREPLAIAEALQEELGVPLKRINSAYRSPRYNSACRGAASNSYHTRNMALDLVFDCSPRKAALAAKRLRSRGRFKGGLGVYSGFIHIDTRGRNANWGNHA